MLYSNVNFKRKGPVSELVHECPVELS